MFHVPLRGSLTLLLAEGLLFILVSLSLGILDLGPHVVAAGGDAGRAGRHDAADHAAVRVHLSDREHAVAAAGDLDRGARRAGSC